MENLYHMLFMGSFVIPVLWCIYRLVQIRKEKVNKISYPPSITLLLTFQYVIAYNVVFFIQELFLAWGKNWIGLTSYLYHNNHGWEGSDPRTALLQGSGALAIFIFGLLMVGLFLVIKKKDTSIWVKTMVLWFVLHGLMQSLPQVTTAFVAIYTDTGQAFNYLGIDGIEGFALALISVVGIIYTSNWLFDQFAELGFFETSNTKSLFVSVCKVVVLPTIIASFLIIPYRIFPWERGFNQFFNLIPWLPWFLLFALIKVKRISTRTLKPGGVIITAAIALIILLVFQLVLAPGVVFTPD